MVHWGQVSWLWRASGPHRLPCAKSTWLLTDIINYFSKFSLTLLVHMYVCIQKSEDNCWGSLGGIYDFLFLEGMGAFCWPEVLFPYLFSTRVANIKYMLSFLGGFWDQTQILMPTWQYITCLAIPNLADFLYNVILITSKAFSLVLSIRWKASEVMENPMLVTVKADMWVVWGY